MLYHLFVPLEKVLSGFRLFRYVSFRAAFAAILAFLVATIVGPGIVKSLRKSQTPTMGGVILLVGVALSSLLFARLDNPYTVAAIVSFLAFGTLGALDDREKLKDPKSKGMSEKKKLLGQLLISTVVIGVLYAAGNQADGTPWLRGMAMKPSPYPSEWVKRHEVTPGEDFTTIAARYLGDAGRAKDVAERNAGLRRDGTLVPPTVGTVIELPQPLTPSSEGHHADFQVRSAYRRILKLSPGQKAMLAMKGGRDERLILIRDTNRVVAASVLKNPRITEKDVEEISRMRNVTEDVLRTIGANREWSKRYTVTLSLVRNPKTPQAISVNFISRLAVKDLKDLSRDKNVPELVRRIAKRTYDQRSQKAESTKKQ